MKLIFFVQMLRPDDTIRGFIPGWCRALARAAGGLTVISQETHTAELGEGIRVLSLGKERGASKFEQALTLASILRLELPRHDAMLTHMTPIYSVASSPFAFLYGRPVFTWYTHSFVGPMLRAAIAVSRRVFTASAESLRVDTKKKCVVGHGIDLAHFLPGPALSSRSGPLRIVSACRLSPVKRVDVLLRALKGLEGDWTLEIAGDAPMESQKEHEAEIRRLASALGSRVTLLGAVPYPKMGELLRRSDLYVNLSGTGSLDKGVLEAVAAGCAVLSGNEAFSTFLEGTQERTFLSRVDEAAVRERLAALIKTSRETLQKDRELLFEKVKREHSLDVLAQRLVSEMGG
ncbi:MAG: glycosyltransferase family 4 protein [Planctomycetota bacterium]